MEFIATENSSKIKKEYSWKLRSTAEANNMNS